MNLKSYYIPIATVLGIGHARFAPGTVASAVALPIAWLIAMSGGRFVLLLAAILVNGVGAWACDLYAREKKEADPSECVIDEVAGQWIACAFAPPPAALFAYGLVPYIIAFLLFRLFDIVKPWPVSAAERLPGGLGIMADDLVAGVFAGIVIAVLVQLRII